MEPIQIESRGKIPAALLRLEVLARAELRRLHDVRPASGLHSAADDPVWHGLAWDLGLDGPAIDRIRAEAAFAEAAPHRDGDGIHEAAAPGPDVSGRAGHSRPEAGRQSRGKLRCAWAHPSDSPED